MEGFKGFRVRVTPEQSREIQETAFENGFVWADGESKVRFTKAIGLVLVVKHEVPFYPSQFISAIFEYDEKLLEEDDWTDLVTVDELLSIIKGEKNA